MATVKSYSVAITADGGSKSTVYSLGSGSTVPASGRNGAYDHPTSEGLVEGRIPTLVNGPTVPVDHDVTAINEVTTVGSACVDPLNAQDVVATTTTITGGGAGLIVKFTTTAAGKIEGTKGNYTIVEGGEGYATDDQVQVDGFEGSVLKVVAAA